MVTTSKVFSQTIDIAISYGLREVQIYLAKQYNRELTRSVPVFSENVVENSTFYVATKTGVPRPSSFIPIFPTNPCGTKWGPLKLSRCRSKIALLRHAEGLVTPIPLLLTIHRSNSSVQSRIRVKTSAILKNISKELLKH